MRLVAVSTLDDLFSDLFMKKASWSGIEALTIKALCSENEEIFPLKMNSDAWLVGGYIIVCGQLSVEVFLSEYPTEGWKDESC